MISAMTNSEARDHLLGALPTGYGKSLPMLVASLLLPPGIECENLLAVLKFDFHRLDNCCHLSFDHHCSRGHQEQHQGKHELQLYQAYIDWRRWTLQQRNWMKTNLSCLLAVSPSSQPCPSNQSRVWSPKSCPASCDWEVGTT